MKKNNKRYFVSVEVNGYDDSIKMVVAQEGKDSFLILKNGGILKTKELKMKQCEHYVLSKKWREIREEEAVLL